MKHRFGLSTDIAEDELSSTQNCKLKKPGSQLETTLLGPRLIPLLNTVLNSTVTMATKQGPTKPQITFFYAAFLRLEQMEHAGIYS